LLHKHAHNIGNNGFKALTKAPLPVLSFVLVAKSIVGVVIVFQTTPLAVTTLPLSELILPPELAEVDKILLADVVVKLGVAAKVLN